jgi:hypothetical protein
MRDDERLDEMLSNFTDQLLAGEDAPVSPELDDLAHVVRQLHRVVAPSGQAAPTFRTQLRQRLQREWVVQHKRQAHLWQNRWVIQAVAASVAVLLLLIVLITASDRGGSEQGTALGGSMTWIAGILIAVFGVGLLVYWFRQRR